MVSELCHLAFLVGLHTLAVSAALAKTSYLKGHKAKHSHQQILNLSIYPGCYPLHGGCIIVTVSLPCSVQSRGCLHGGYGCHQL